MLSAPPCAPRIHRRPQPRPGPASEIGPNKAAPAGKSPFSPAPAPRHPPPPPRKIAVTPVITQATEFCLELLSGSLPDLEGRMSAPHPQSRVTWTAYKGLSAAPSLPAASSLRALSSRARASALFSRAGDTWALLLFFFLLIVCLFCFALLQAFNLHPLPPRPNNSAAAEPETVSKV